MNLQVTFIMFMKSHFFQIELLCQLRRAVSYYTSLVWGAQIELLVTARRTIDRAPQVYRNEGLFIYENHHKNDNLLRSSSFFLYFHIGPTRKVKNSYDFSKLLCKILFWIAVLLRNFFCLSMSPPRLCLLPCFVAQYVAIMDDNNFDLIQR